MSIYRRSTLTWQEQLKLEREQFNNIDNPEHQKWLQINIEYWKNMTSRFPETASQMMMKSYSINKEHVQLSHEDFCKLYMIRDDKGTRLTRFNVSVAVVQNYISCICRYVNARRRTPLPSSSGLTQTPDPPDGPEPNVSRRKTFTVPGTTRSPKARPAESSSTRGRTDTNESTPGPSTRTRSRSPVSGQPRHGYRERPTIEPQLLGKKNKGPSCVMMTMETFDHILTSHPTLRPAAIATAFRDLGVDPGKFMELDYIFVPRYTDGHYYLMGLAPAQTFAFVIDSMGFDEENETTFILQEMIAYGVQGSNAPPSWSIFGQWARRRATEDDSPDAAQQRDNQSCGIFTVTNTFCLAFGYDLLCFANKDLDTLKRRRMAVELMNGGFGGEAKLHYPLLDLPGNDYTLFDPELRASEYYKIRNTPIPPDSPESRRNPPPGLTTHEDPDDDPMDYEMEDDDFPDHEQRAFQPGRHINRKDRAKFPRLRKLRTPAQRTEKELDDLLVRIFNYKPCTKAIAPPPDAAADPDGPEDEDTDEENNYSDGNNGQSEVVPIPTSDELFVAARRLLDGPDCPEKTAYLTKITEMDNRPWPPQFNQRVHQKAGFVYNNSILPEGYEIKAPSSRKALRDGCRAFPLRGVNEMKKMTRDGARKWAENEMNAFMAKALDEVKTKPFPGLGRGFHKHKSNLDASLAAARSQMDEGQ